MAKTPTKRWKIGLELLLYALILLTAWKLRSWFVGGLDLRDHAGAAGPITLSQAAMGDFHRGYDVWLIGLLMPWENQDPLAAARLLGMCSSLAMVLGAIMGGWAVAGRSGAVGAGTLTAVWSLSIYPSIVVGADPPAFGLVWLAAGMTWLGARFGWRGIPLLVSGCVLAGVATAVKESALPGVVVAAMAPLVVRGPPRSEKGSRTGRVERLQDALRRRLAPWLESSESEPKTENAEGRRFDAVFRARLKRRVLRHGADSAVVGLVLVLPMALVTYLSLEWAWAENPLVLGGLHGDIFHWPIRSKFIFAEIPPVTLGSFRHGWWVVDFLPERQMAAGVFDDLTWLCLLALLPGPAWKQRAALCLGSLGCLWLCARTIEVASNAPVVPRRLIGVCFGLVVMAGVGLGSVQHLLRRRMWLSWVPLIGVASMFAMDSWAYFHAWGHQRVEIAGARPPSFSSPPAAWANRYRSMTDLDFRDLSAYGSVAFVDLVESNPGGVALPRLRDERHAHLTAAAELAGVPYVVVDPGTCRASPSQVVRALDEAGILLALPSDIPGVNRVNGENQYREGRADCMRQPSDYCWLLQLRQAVDASGGLRDHGRFWQIRPATGTGGTIPCQFENPTSRGEY